MKALSIKQPWANWIARGYKTIETRKWYTSYRGRLLICSSKKPVIAPAGCIVAVADLVDCRYMKPNDEKAARTVFRPDTFCWVLENVRQVKPVPVRGALGIFDWPIEESELELSGTGAS